jgi:hypothetical protein
LEVTVAKPMVPLALTRLVVAVPLGSASVSTERAGASVGAASLNRSKGGTRPMDWCGRWWL